MIPLNNSAPFERNRSVTEAQGASPAGDPTTLSSILNMA